MATSYNIETIQGDNIQLSLRVRDTYNVPINLSGYDVRGVVRYAYGYTGDQQILLNLNPFKTIGRMPYLNSINPLFIY